MLHEEVILLSKLINVFRHFLLVDFCCNGFLIGPLFDEIKTVAYLLLPSRTQKLSKRFVVKFRQINILPKCFTLN